MYKKLFIITLALCMSSCVSKKLYTDLDARYRAAIEENEKLSKENQENKSSSARYKGLLDAANAELETRVAEASDAAVICYAASQNLNMIPAESAEAIHLVAMDTRPMTQRAQTVTDQIPAVTGSTQRVSASNAD